MIISSKPWKNTKLRKLSFMESNKCMEMPHQRQGQPAHLWTHNNHMRRPIGLSVEYGSVMTTGLVSTPMSQILVPLGVSDPTSMLSYSQRDYNIQISNYINFVVRILKIYQLPPFRGLTTMSRIIKFTHIKLSWVLNFLYTRCVKISCKFISVP
jgi:hypothetical protein